MSPVCSKNSGGVDNPVILSTAAFNVPATSGFAGLLKPMWLSLICTKLSSPVAAARDAAPEGLLKAYDFSTPPCITHSAPVPAHAMHFRNPRRSMPSLLWSCTISSLTFFTISVLPDTSSFRNEPASQESERREMVFPSECPRRSGTCSVCADQNAVRLFQIIGIFNLVRHLRKLGIKSKAGR